MRRDQGFSVGQAPSVADVVAALDRGGRVDFGTDLRARDADRDREPEARTSRPDRPSMPDVLAPVDAEPPAAPVPAARRPVDDLFGPAADLDRAAAAAGAVDDRLEADELDRLEAAARVDLIDVSALTGPQTTVRPRTPDDVPRDARTPRTAHPASPSDVELDELPEGRADALEEVREVADAVVAAMRSLHQAHERHVEALELEAARRCELLTARAELDAELIRLNARREAHTILAASQLRVEPQASLADVGRAGDPVGELGVLFSEFAETVEQILSPAPEPPGRSHP